MSMPALASNDPILFVMAQDANSGARVAAALGIATAPFEERSFEDGEHKGRPLVSVRSRDVYVLGSLYGDVRHSVDERVLRMLFFIGAVKDAGAGHVTAVVPFLAYARKDQKSQTRDPVTTKYIARMFEAVGTDRIVTLDVHNLAAFQNAFRCGTEHLDPAGLFAAHLAPRLRDREVTVVAPDPGAIKRTDRLRRRLETLLDRPVASGFSEKHRALGVVRGSALVGEVANRSVLIVDDMIVSGTTLARTAAACVAAGARDVTAVATHGMFVGDASRSLAASAINTFVVTDSIAAERVQASELRGRVEVVSVAGLLAGAIRCLHTGGSLVDLLEA